MFNMTKQQIGKILAGAQIETLVENHNLSLDNIDDVFEIIGENELHEVIYQMFYNYITEVDSTDSVFDSIQK